MFAGNLFDLFLKTAGSLVQKTINLIHLLVNAQKALQVIYGFELAAGVVEPDDDQMAKQFPGNPAITDPVINTTKNQLRTNYLCPAVAERRNITFHQSIFLAGKQVHGSLHAR